MHPKGTQNNGPTYVWAPGQGKEATGYCRVPKDHRSIGISHSGSKASIRGIPAIMV